jgi:hypothetical protein
MVEAEVLLVLAAKCNWLVAAAKVKPGDPDDLRAADNAAVVPMSVPFAHQLLELVPTLAVLTHDRFRGGLTPEA